MWRAAADTFPLCNVHPTLSTVVRLDRTAIDDLATEVLTRDGFCDLTETQNPPARHFRVDSRISGEWIWVCWQKRETAST